MSIETKSIKRIRQGNVGIYAWKLPNGKLLGNDQGDMLNIPAKYGDIEACMKLRRAAEYYGFPEGSPTWLDQQRCTEQELQDQLQDLIEQGWVPPEAHA